MKVRITPSTCQGEVTIPPSKSMSHRAIICAALAAGVSKISNIAYSDDIKITIAGMRSLGATIETFDDHLLIEGIQNFQQPNDTTIFCKESGSTLRFFIPIFSLCQQPIAFTGENRLLKRPQTIYETIFKNQGIPYYQDDQKIEINGCLKSGKYELDGNVSSQFISGLLFTLPLLEGNSTIHIKEPYESRSYVDLTLEMLAYFGVRATYQDANTLYIEGNQTFQPFDYTVEGDYSQAAFFAVLASINHDLNILGVAHESKQGDKVILDIVEKFGAEVKNIEQGYQIKKGDLVAQTIDLRDCPDLGPILTVLMMYTKGKSTLYNAERLQYKESDRGAAMERELQMCGVDITATDHEIIVHGHPPYTCESILSGHKDHRIVMALAIAATCMQKPVVIEHAEFINKSYPTFFEDLKQVGIKVEIPYE